MRRPLWYRLVLFNSEAAKLIDKIDFSKWHVYKDDYHFLCSPDNETVLFVGSNFAFDSKLAANKQPIGADNMTLTEQAYLAWKIKKDRGSSKGFSRLRELAEANT